MADSRAALASWARFENVLGSANTAIRPACGTNSCRIYVFARSTSKARIRLDSRKSVRSFKGIISDDISEFESYMPSQAVQFLAAIGDRSESARHFAPYDTSPNMKALATPSILSTMTTARQSRGRSLSCTFFVLVIIVVGVSRRHRVAHDGDEAPSAFASDRLSPTWASRRRGMRQMSSITRPAMPLR
jgi:hypothetical protein